MNTVAVPPTAAQVAAVLAGADCLADRAMLDAAIDRVAGGIGRDLHALQPLVLCVMRGGMVFAGQLLPRLPFPLLFDYVHVTRYDGATEAGELQWKVRPSLSPAGRHVLLVDDILDVGLTLEAITLWCREQGALSVRTAVLVEKQHARKVRPGLRADYAGLQVADRYVFGYGLDWHGYWRNAPGIYAVAQDH